jgi:hypothetical protein
MISISAALDILLQDDVLRVVAKFSSEDVDATNVVGVLFFEESQQKIARK